MVSSDDEHKYTATFGSGREGGNNRAAFGTIGGHFVMNPADAAFATKNYLKPKFAVPIHYGTFPQLKGTPAEYTKALGKTTTKVMAINPGDSLQF